MFQFPPDTAALKSSFKIGKSLSSSGDLTLIDVVYSLLTTSGDRTHSLNSSHIATGVGNWGLINKVLGGLL